VDLLNRILPHNQREREKEERERERESKIIGMPIFLSYMFGDNNSFNLKSCLSPIATLSQSITYISALNWTSVTSLEIIVNDSAMNVKQHGGIILCN